MIVGICGFCWSGSGAVLDFLMEFSDNQVVSSEFDIAYHPDGLCDLDFNLNENCAKFLSSGVAIPRFRNVSKLLLSSITKGKEKSITEDFIKKITQSKWIGAEEGQVLLHNQWLYNKIGMRIRYKIINRLPMWFCLKHKIYPLNEMYFSVRPQNFYKYAQEYTNNIFESMGLDLKRPIIVNQLFPGNMPSRSMRYFFDSKAIVVDRDPRDVYISLKAVFPGHSYSVPLDNVENFVAYFKNMHSTIKDEIVKPNILYLKFEDFVFKHESVAEKIRSFLNLGIHSDSQKYFVPEQSSANTRVYKKFPEYKDDIKYIEEHLSEYLYDFSNIPESDNSKEMFDDNPRSLGYKFI